MGSTSSALTSSLSSADSILAPITFTGVSTYSSDLQQVLSRAVSIAQLPVQALQNDQTTIESKISGLQTLNPLVAAVASDLTTLGSLASGQILSATSSEPSLVSATASGATSAASYTISNITSVASTASATSATSYANSTTTTVSSAGNLQLVVGGQTLNITLGSGKNNLAGLVSAINGIFNSPVTASILTTSSGNYLSISANSTGKLAAFQLNDIPSGGGASTNLLSTSSSGLSLGSDAVFQLNGIAIDQSSNTINNVVSGLTFNILGTTSSDETVSVSLAPDPSTLTDALQNLVSDYNSLLTGVNGQGAQYGGALSGDSLLYQIQEAMQQAATYQGASGSAVQSLSDLGITMSDTGAMTLDSTVVGDMSSSQLSSALTYLGSSSTGLGSLASRFTQISDPLSGMIEVEENSDLTQDQNLQSQVDAANARITTMQNNLQRQLAGADAAIANLQTQQTVLTSSIQANDLTMYGQNFGSAVPSST